MKIAVVGAEPFNGSSTNLMYALTATRGTIVCTNVPQSSGESLLDFDLIITTRVDSFTAGVKDNVLTAFESGVPVICGFDRDNTVYPSITGLSATSLVARMGLSASSYQGSDKATLITSKTNSFQADYPNGAAVTLHQSFDFQHYTQDAHLAPSAVSYFSYMADAGTCALAIAPKGGVSLIGDAFPAACAYAGFIYASNSAYSVDGSKLLIDLIDKVMSANISTSIKGFSTNENGEPVPGTLYLYSHADGSLKSVTTTKPDGSYEFTIGAGSFFVVCDDGDINHNLKVHSRVSPY